MPFVGQPTVDTHIMSILCNATRFRVHCHIFMLGMGVQRERFMALGQVLGI